MLPSNDPETKPSNPDQGAGQGVEQPKSEPITRDHLDQTLKQFREGIQEMLNKNYQGVQSKTDSYQQNVTNQIGAFEKQLRELQARGIVNMSEAQIRQAVREDAIDKVIAGGQGQGQSNGQPPTQEPATPAGNDLAAKVMADAAAIEKQYGIQLEDNDPEIAQFKIDEYATSPNYWQYLSAVEQAAKTKAERLKRQGPARTPGILQHTPDTGNPLEGVTDLNAIWERTSLGKLRS